MFNRAKEKRDSKVVQVRNWADFVPALEKNCMVLTPFCDIEEWEEKVKVSLLIIYLCYFVLNLFILRKCRETKHLMVNLRRILAPRV